MSELYDLYQLIDKTPDGLKRKLLADHQIELADLAMKAGYLRKTPMDKKDVGYQFTEPGRKMFIRMRKNRS